MTEIIVLEPTTVTPIVEVLNERGPAGDPGADGADGDLPYFASAHAAIAAADKLAGQKADGTKGHFTVQQLIEMALAYNAGMKTANAPILNLSETWNNGAVAFTGLKYNATDTASLAASLLMDLQVNGVSRLIIQKSGRLTINNNEGIYLGSGGGLIIGGTVFCQDGANNIGAMRNGANAQAFRLYNTYTDASNYERAFVRWVSNQLEIGGEAAGTGLNRNLQITAGGDLKLGGGNTVFWRIAGGHFRPETDNAVNLGVAGTNRIANIYAAGSVVADNYQAAASASFYWSARSRMFSDADGGIRFSNNGQTDFGLLRFGGVSASFPAIKRQGANLDLRLADDSGYCSVNLAGVYATVRMRAPYFEVTDGIAAPGGAATFARIYVDAADGDLKVVFGDGTVKTIVTDT